MGRSGRSSKKSGGHQCDLDKGVGDEKRRGGWIQNGRLTRTNFSFKELFVRFSVFVGSFMRGLFVYV